MIKGFEDFEFLSRITWSHFQRSFYLPFDIVYVCCVMWSIFTFWKILDILSSTDVINTLTDTKHNKKTEKIFCHMISEMQSKYSSENAVHIWCWQKTNRKSKQFFFIIQYSYWRKFKSINQKALTFRMCTAQCHTL